MKIIKFSSQYRRGLLTGLARRTILETTRIFDDKDLRVGDQVMLVASDTGAALGTAEVVAVRTTVFDAFLAEAKDANGTRSMYEGYYGRDIAASEPVKLVSLRIDNARPSRGSGSV